MKQSKRHATFGQTLRELLKDNGHTVRSFAKLSGYSSSYIGLILKDQRSPPPDQIAKWATWLKVARGSPRQDFIAQAHAARVSAKVDCRAIVEEMRRGLAELAQSQDSNRLALDALLMQLSQRPHLPGVQKVGG